MNAIQFPLSRITIAFIFGILVAHFSTIDFNWAIILIAISFVFFGGIYFWSQRQWIQYSFFSIATYFFSFCIGLFSLIIHSSSNQKDNYLNQIHSFERPHQTEIVLREKLKNTKFYQKYVSIVYKIDHQNCSGKILLNFRKGCLPNNVRIGTRLCLFTTIIRHKPPLNPDQFDYSQYLSTKSIVAQTNVENAQFILQGTVEKDLFYYADVLRTKLLDNLQKAHFSKPELNVLAALILGQQQDIAQNIVHDYQLAGAVHILSVSGLHVGFIVLFLGFLLKFLPKTQWSNVLQLSIVLISLWGFAFIAGLSPSVIRSVAMFSFVTIGLHLKRKTNMFHTLLVSLLLILLFEPSFLFDVGFQLSYLALFFILWLQPLLGSVWEPKSKITKYFWDIITVSIAAQLGTLPLSIYYFHQFPGLFFLTNLIVIPLLSIIMGLGLLLVLISLVGLTPPFLVAVVAKSIALMNYIIHQVASYDQFVFTDIPLNLWMVFCLYLVIVLFVLYVNRPTFLRIAFLFCGITLIQASYFIQQWNIQNENNWIVFNCKKSSAILDRIGEKVILYCDEFEKNKSNIQPYLTANFLKIAQEKTIPNLMFSNGKKIVIIDRTASYPRHVSPDILLIRQSPKINLERVFLQCKPKLVIVDGSNYKSYAVLWKSTCSKEKIPFYNTYEKGFYQLEK